MFVSRPSFFEINSIKLKLLYVLGIQIVRKFTFTLMCVNLIIGVFSLKFHSKKYISLTQTFFLSRRNFCIDEIYFVFSNMNREDANYQVHILTLS